MTNRISARGLDPAGGTPGQSPVISPDGLLVDWGDVSGVSTGDALPSAAVHPGELFVLMGSTTTTDPMLGADDLHPTDAGMTHLADAYEDALSVAGKTPAGDATLTAYGDSWTASDTNNSAGMRAIHQLRDRLSLTLTNRAVNGYRAGDVAGYAIKPGSPYNPGSSDMVFVQVGVNDLTSPDSTHSRDVFENQLRAFLAVASAAERIEESAFTYTGTWGTNTGKVASGGGNKAATVTGSTASITITTPGTYYLLAHGTDPDATFNGGQFTISQGGTTLAVLDMDDRVDDTGKQLIDHYGPLAVRLDGVAAGTLTITFDTLGRTGAQGWIDALLRISPTPPTILAAKPVRVLTADRQKPDLLDAYRAAYDTLAAEFGSHLVVADPAPGWAPDGTYTDPSVTPSLWYSDGTAWTQPTADAAMTLALADLTDVTTTAPADGDVLTYDTATATWTSATPASGGGTGVVETIVPGTGISVDDTDPANPIVSATGGGGGGATTLDDLSDVDLTTTPPTSGQVLEYDGSLWVPATPAGGGGGGGFNPLPVDDPANWSADLGYDYEFDAAGSALPGSWAWVNQGGAAYNEAFGGGAITLPGEGSWSIHSARRSLPATWDTITAKIGFAAPYTSDTLMGLVLADSSSGKFYTFGAHAAASGAVGAIDGFLWNSPTSPGATKGQINYAAIMISLIYLRIKYVSSTSLLFQVSLDGIAWTTVSSPNPSTDSVSVNTIGFGGCAKNGSAGAALACHFLRVR